LRSNQYEGGQNGGPENRQRHPDQRSQVRCSADLGRFFKGNVEGGHRWGEDQIGDGQIQQSLHQDHSLKRVDVEWRTLQGEYFLQEQVDHTIGGVQEKDPADGEKDMGDHHRNDRDDTEQKFERDIASRIQVGQKQGQTGSDKGGPDGEYNRIDNDAGKFGIRVGLRVLIQGEAAEGSETLREAPEDKHDDGAYRQKTDNYNQAWRQCRSWIKRPVHFDSTKQ